jgi:hypothetical protein
MSCMIDNMVVFLRFVVVSGYVIWLKYADGP